MKQGSLVRVFFLGLYSIPAQAKPHTGTGEKGTKK